MQVNPAVLDPFLAAEMTLMNTMDDLLGGVPWNRLLDFAASAGPPRHCLQHVWAGLGQLKARSLFIMQPECLESDIKPTA